MANISFDYGSMYGAITESDKTPAELITFDYGSMYGVIIGVGAAGGAEVTPTRLIRRGRGRTFTRNSFLGAIGLFLGSILRFTYKNQVV